MAPHPEATGRSRAAPADAEGREHGLFGEHRELAGRHLNAYLAHEAEPAAPATRSARVLAKRGALDAHRVELLHRLDRLNRGHVALGPRAHRVAAIAPVEAAGAAGRILVEDEGLTSARVGPAHVAVVAASLVVAGDSAAEGLGERAHHRRLHAVLDLDHAAAGRGR